MATAMAGGQHSSWQSAFQAELAKMDNKIWELFVREKQARENLKEELFSEMRRETAGLKHQLAQLGGNPGATPMLSPGSRDWPAPRITDPLAEKEVSRMSNVLDNLTVEVAALEEELDAFRVRQRLQFIASGMLALCAPEFGSQDKINYMAGLGEEERDIQECLKKLEASKGTRKGDERLRERLGLARTDDRFGINKVMGMSADQMTNGAPPMIHLNPAFQQAQQNMQQNQMNAGRWSWFGNQAPPQTMPPGSMGPIAPANFIGSTLI